MKTNLKTLLISGVAAVTLFTSCQKDPSTDPVQYAEVLAVTADGTSTFISKSLQSAFVATNDLTDAELASLIKMKNDEKLARDVYSSLYTKWGSDIFSRISAAEENHLNAIIFLLKTYGSADTLAGDAGVFDDSGVQTLYNELVTNGSASIEEAYKTGALIEELDIKDLVTEEAATTNANILVVYENLERGSRNHLRAFYNQLSLLGLTYSPVYITQEEYEAIVTTPVEKGNQYRMNGKGHGKGNGTGTGTCDNTGTGKRWGKN
jgi:hypothetical protein